MAEFRKKPIVIEAEQIETGAYKVPFNYPFRNEGAEYRERGIRMPFEIKTLEGWYQIHDGDWIIKGIQGEFYPIKADIFEETYEALDGNQAS
jgi:hypothetical protein